MSHGCGEREMGADSLAVAQATDWLHLRHLSFYLVTICPMLVSIEIWLVFVADNLEYCYSL